MRKILEAILSFLQALTLYLSLKRDDKLRSEGANQERLNEYERAFKHQKTAQEIDYKVSSGLLTDDDREWLSQFKRSPPP